ncbi:hypothetical protein BJX96DRAFT_186734 [Aspergillus floccosus]
MINLTQSLAFHSVWKIFSYLAVREILHQQCQPCSLPLGHHISDISVPSLCHHRMSQGTGQASPTYELLDASAEDHDHNTDACPESRDPQGLKTPLSASSQEPEKAEDGSQRSFESDWYVWEALGVGISGAILIVMVAILASYDDTPEPMCRYMSLNSLISWLSTASKGCILFSISEALGQMKWTWFMQAARPIPDLRRFDTASRGFYGAIKLIWRLQARHFAALSCLAVILALGFDPFTQNLIHYEQKMTVDTSRIALVGNASTVDSYGFLSSSGVLGVDTVLKLNVYNILLNPDRRRAWAIPQYSCSSANCTWDVVASLETRALCANITKHLVKSCKESTEGGKNLTRCDISLPQSNTTASFYKYLGVGDRIAGFKGFVSAQIESNFSLVYTNATMFPIQFITPRVANISILSDRAADPNTWRIEDLDTWAATECVIEPVVRASRPSVQGNVFTDDTLAVWNTVITPSNERDGYRFSPPWGDDMGMQPNQTFFLSYNAKHTTSGFISDILSGNFFRSSIMQEYTPTLDQTSYTPYDILRAIGQGEIVGCSLESTTRLQCVMQNIAAAISKSFRDSVYIQAASNPDNAKMATGRVLTSVTYVSVHWQWIVLPVLVWILGAVTLVGTIWKTWGERVPRWRNNPLPLLFLYRDEISGAELGEKLAQIEFGEVKHMRARLYESNGNMILG